MSPNSKFCANCGSPLDKDALFCSECGAAVTEIKNSRENTPKPVQEKSKMRKKIDRLSQKSKQKIHQDKNKTSNENTNSKSSTLRGLFITLFIILAVMGYVFYIEQQQGKPPISDYQKKQFLDYQKKFTPSFTKTTPDTEKK